MDNKKSKIKDASLRIHLTTGLTENEAPVEELMKKGSAK